MERQSQYPTFVWGVDPAQANLLHSPEVLWGAETRRDHLLSLPHEGFTAPQHRQMVEDMVTVGFPVNNIQRLAYKPNRRGEPPILGSWGLEGDQKGEFAIYKLLHQLPRQAHAGTYVHEGSHAVSPLDYNNAPLYGGEASLFEAADFAEDVAGQSILTGKYLNGYHRFLAQLLALGPERGGITPTHFVEETSAIANELAVTNRAHLQQVQEAQRAEIDNLRRARLLPPNFGFTELMSYPSRGGMVLAGADKTLVKLLDGVNDYAGLQRHIQHLKAHFASPPPPRPEVVGGVPDPFAVERALAELVMKAFGPRARPFIVTVYS